MSGRPGARGPRGVAGTPGVGGNVFVYQPGRTGELPGNVYTTFAAINAKQLATEGPCLIHLDPAYQDPPTNQIVWDTPGAYNFEGCTIGGDQHSDPNVPIDLILGDGFTFVGKPPKFDQGVRVISRSSAPIMVSDGTPTRFELGLHCELRAQGGAPFLRVPAGLVSIVILGLNSRVSRSPALSAAALLEGNTITLNSPDFAQAGLVVGGVIDITGTVENDGSRTVTAIDGAAMTVDGAAFTPEEVDPVTITEQGGNVLYVEADGILVTSGTEAASRVGANTIGGGGGWVRVQTPACEMSSQQDDFSGSVIPIILGQAALVAYTPADSSKWESPAPSLTSGALDDLAARPGIQYTRCTISVSDLSALDPDVKSFSKQFDAELPTGARLLGVSFNHHTFTRFDDTSGGIVEGAAGPYDPGSTGPYFTITDVGSSMMIAPIIELPNPPGYRTEPSTPYFTLESSSDLNTYIRGNIEVELCYATS